MPISLPSPNYGLSRIDNERSRSHGWLVTIQRRGEVFRRLFSDGPYGGAEHARTAAIQYRDEVLAQHPPLSKVAFCGILKKSNSTGISGVSRICLNPTAEEAARRYSWIATWPTPDGKRMRRKFSELRYGPTAAREAAIQARDDGLSALAGESFNPGLTPRQRASGHRERAA